MLVRSYRYEEWILRELGRIAHENSDKKKGVISIAALTRLSIYLFLIKQSRRPSKVTKKLIADAGFEARKLSQ